MHQRRTGRLAPRISAAAAAAAAAVRSAPASPTYKLSSRSPSNGTTAGRVRYLSIIPKTVDAHTDGSWKGNNLSVYTRRITFERTPADPSFRLQA